MTVDLEDRLRATYRAVAEQTAVGVVEPPTLGAAAVVPLDERRRRRPRALLAAAAAVAAALVVGLVVVNRSGDPAVTDLERLAPTLRYGALSRPPDGFGLVRVDAAAGRLHYVGPRSNIILTVGDLPLEYGVSGVEPTSVVVRGRVGSLLAAETTQVLQWTEREGVFVTLEVYGELARTGDVVALADSVVMVSTDAWELLSARTGFAGPPMMDGPDRAVVDEDMPGLRTDEPLTRSLQDTLQNGVFVQYNGALGFAVPQDRPMVTRMDDSDVVFVLAPVGTVRAEILSDGVVLTSVVPIPDPAAPSLLAASVEVPGISTLGRNLLARFLDANGGVIDEVRVG